MAKVEFDIPKNLIDEAAKKKIAELERKLKNAENREKRLKEKLSEIDNQQETINSLQKNVEEMVYKLDMSWWFDRA